MKLLTRRGVLIEEEGGSSCQADVTVTATATADADADADAVADSDEARSLRPLQAAACTYRIAFGPRGGRNVSTVQGAMPRDAVPTQALCADRQGLSLHAGVRCDAHERQRLE